MPDIKIDTSAILSAAGKIDSLNEEMAQALRESLAFVQGLGSFWQGPAASAAISGYEAFAAANFGPCQERLRAYSSYLTGVSAGNWGNVEALNAKIGDDLP